jgi:hypothetical protein
LVLGSVPITVAARSKAWNVFARSNTVIVCSNLTQRMDVCLWPCDGLIPRPRNPTDCLTLRNWSETKRFKGALCSKWEQQEEVENKTRVHRPPFKWGIFSRPEYESPLSISDIYNVLCVPLQFAATACTMIELLCHSCGEAVLPWQRKGNNPVIVFAPIMTLWSWLHMIQGVWMWMTIELMHAPYFFFVQGVLASPPPLLLKRLMRSYGITVEHKKYIIIHNLHFQVSLSVLYADGEFISSSEMDNIFTWNL